VAGWLDQLLPRVRGRLPATRPVEPAVWVQRELRLHEGRLSPHWIDGFTTSSPDRIHLREEADELEAVLCHELVHLALDDSWAPLPTVIEEGLCERIAIELTASRGARYFTSKRMVAAVYLGMSDLLLVRRFQLPDALEVRSVVMLSMQVEMSEKSAGPLECLELSGGYSDIRDGRIGAEHYGFGTWLVDRIIQRIGYGGLHDLCLRATESGEDLVSPEQILAAAGLPADPVAWRPILASSITATDLAVVAEGFRAPILESVSSFLQGRFNGKRLADYPRSGLSLSLKLLGGRRLELRGDRWWPPELSP